MSMFMLGYGVGVVLGVGGMLLSAWIEERHGDA